jgi:hypothetical protein
MFKRILLIVVLVIGIVGVMAPAFDAAHGMISNCFICANTPWLGLCIDSQLSGMGNCSKDDSCCYLSVDIAVHRIYGTCCNPADNCGGESGRAFWDADISLASTSAIGAQQLSGKGTATSHVFFSSCEIYDRLFCAQGLESGCYRYDDATNTYIRETTYQNGELVNVTPDAKELCPADAQGNTYVAYRYCPSSYSQTKLNAVQCFNGNPKWSPQPPPCPTVLNPALWSMSYAGDVRITDMTVDYRKWSFKDSTGLCYYPECPKESLERHYWLENVNDLQYTYDPSEDQTIPCPP